jgi:DNA-binding XRE family transcriptional regulator
MAELSLTPAERSRKAFSRVLQRLQDPGTQRNLANMLGVSESTISRIKTEKLEDALALLYQLGFKVVPQDRYCVPADYLHALQVMAREHMLRADQPSLQWDD